MALDRFAVCYKIGDQLGFDGLKHGDPICYIDEEEWGLPLDKIIGPNNYRVFLVMEHDKKMKPFIVDCMQSVGMKPSPNPIIIEEPDRLYYRARKYRLDIDSVQTALDMPYLEQDALAKDVTVPLVNAKAIDDKSFVNSLTEPLDTGKVDGNAIASGSYTVGAAMNYATWALFGADVTTLTGDLTGTQKTATAETAQCTINQALAGHALTLTSDTNPLGNFGAGWISTQALTTAHWFLITCSSASSGATINISKLNMKFINARATAYAAIVFAANTANITNKANDCIVNLNSLLCNGIGDNGGSSLSKIFNCVIANIVAAAASGYGMATANTGSVILENCTCYNTRLGFWNYNNSNTVAITNCAAFANSKDYANAAAANAGLGNTTASKDASGDTTGSEAGLRSLTAANEFVSLDIASADFLKVKAGNLNDAGVAPGIAANTYGIRGNARPHGALYSIGADEYAASGGTCLAAYTTGYNDETYLDN